MAASAVSARAAQPQSRIVFDVGFGDRDLCAFADIDDCRKRRQKLRSNFAEVLRQIFAFVVREEAVFLGIVDDIVRRET